jgi:hypothetical protein
MCRQQFRTRGTCGRLKFASDPAPKLVELVHSPATVFGGRPVSTESGRVVHTDRSGYPLTGRVGFADAERQSL